MGCCLQLYMPSLISVAKQCCFGAVNGFFAMLLSTVQLGLLVAQLFSLLLQPFMSQLTLLSSLSLLRTMVRAPLYW